MKTNGKKLAMLLGLILIGLYGCTHDDRETVDIVPSPGENFSETELLARKTTVLPEIDGIIDAAWSEAQELRVTAKVPDPGNDVFKGYVGNTNRATLRALYDDTYLYVLVEWDDNNEDFNRDTWYFDPATSLWMQEKNKPLFNNEGVKTRDAFYEDKLAVLFDINNSVADWNNQTCFASCHTNLSQADGYARHFTNNESERIEMWHWKYVRTNFYGHLDDQFQNNDQPNGRKNDDGTNPAPNNSQTLTTTDTGVSISVPKYFIPNREYYGWITIDEINAGTAKLITSVASNGNLTYDGGIIDPVAEPRYQRDGSTTGAFGMPSVFVQAPEGSRGDVLAKGVYTGSGWVLEIKRKINTGDTNNQDVDFSSLEEFPFGMAIFDNAAIAHGIKPNLKLIFEK